jgi:uncharacterized protein YodC (DUF2158 family)
MKTIMEEVIEVGSVVRLRSGGPLMRVDKISADKSLAYCSWPGDNGITYSDIAFLTAVLEVIKIEDGIKIFN